MERGHLAPVLGILGCLGLLVALAYPYLAAESGGVGLYYGTGAVNPLVAALFAIVTIVVLAAGREGRTDPILAAGICLVFGLIVVTIAAAWALTVRLDVIEVWPDHRWVTVAVSALVPVSGAWWARELGVF